MANRRVYNLTDHWFPDKMGGSCIYAYRLHKLMSTCMDAETITLVGDPTPYERQMVVHKVLHKARFIKNRKTIRTIGTDRDAIWVVHSPWFLLHLFLAFGCRIRTRVVAVYHGPWYREYFHSASAKGNICARLALTLVRYVIELFYCVFVARFVFLSETMFRQTSEYLPLGEHRAHIIPMWSDRNKWDPPRRPNQRRVISTFRRLEPRMGLQDLIESLDRFDTDDFTLIIGGDGPYKRELMDLVQRRNLHHRVKFLGWVTEAEKIRLIRRSDAVILPSRNLEGFSLLALEALENGTPVLLTEAVGFYEYVQGINQEFVKRIDLERERVEVKRFLSLGDRRRGLEAIRSIFDSESVRQRLLAVLSPGPRFSGAGPSDRVHCHSICPPSTREVVRPSLYDTAKSG